MRRKSTGGTSYFYPMPGCGKIHKVFPKEGTKFSRAELENYGTPVVLEEITALQKKGNYNICMSSSWETMQPNPRVPRSVRAALFPLVLKGSVLFVSTKHGIEL